MINDYSDLNWCPFVAQSVLSHGRDTIEIKSMQSGSPWPG